MKERKQSEFAYAVPKTVPVMVGYLFLGAAYGILMNVNGFGIWWTLAASVLVYAGSLQYLGVTMLMGGFAPMEALAMSLMLNARHLFYGVSMLEKYGKFQKRWRKWYAVFGLTDETFSIVCHEEIPKELNADKVYLWITVLDHVYWVLGSVIGTWVGALIRFDTTGLDFALTALFVVIFTEQWNQKEGHMPAVLGVAASIFCIVLFGKDTFIIPAMIVIGVVLGIGYKKGGKKHE